MKEKLSKLKKLKKLSRNNKRVLVLLASLSFLFFFVSPNNDILEATAYTIIVDNDVDADSNVDVTANKGTDGATDYTDAQTQDDTDQVILESDEGGGGGAYIEDYVDNEDSNVDSVADLGVITDFSNMQASDSSYANISETAGGGSATLVDYVYSEITTQGTSIVMTAPSGIEEGDLCLLLMGSEDASTGDHFNAETGWAKIDESGDDTADAHAAAYWKEAGASEGDVTIDVASSDYVWGWYLRVISADTIDPINNFLFGQSSSSATSHTAVEIATDEDDTLAFYLLAFDGGDGYTFTISGTGWNEEDEQQISTSGQSGSGVFGWKNMTTQGDTIDAVIGCSGTGDGAAWFQLAINSAGGTGDYNMDQEVQFTNVIDYLATEEICIETGSFGSSEDINVTLWSDGSSWVSVTDDLTASTWNNYTVQLNSSTFTIKFGGSTTSSDSVEDYWLIDSVLLQVSGAGSGDDAIDSDSTDIDSASDNGSVSNWSNMQANDGSIANFTETSGGGGSGYIATLEGLSPDHHWLLDGDETDSIGGLDSDGGNDPDWVTDIIPNSEADESGDYNGNDDETLVPNGDYNNEQTAGSVSLWFIVDTVDTTNGGGILWSEGGPSNGLAIYTYDDSGTYNLYVNFYVGTAYDYMAIEVSVATLYHLVVTFDCIGDEIYVYLDGSEAASDLSLAIGSSFAAHSAGTAIGGSDSSVDNHLAATLNGLHDGEIASVARWSTVELSSTDASDLYDAGALSGGNYTLDQEFAFTGIPQDMTGYNLTIDTTTTGAENLIPQIWNATSSSWADLDTDLDGSSWNNYTVTDYITASTIYIQFRDYDKTTDSTTQDYWLIDYVGLYIWSAGGSNFQGEWEHQCQSVDINKDYYELTVYGFTSDAESFEIQMWDHSGSDWDAALSTTIDTSEQWYNQSFSSSYVDTASEEVTWRYRGTSESTDTTQTTLRIDYAGIRAYNFSIYGLPSTFNSLVFPPDNSYHAFDDSPLSFVVESGTTYDIQVKSVDGTGTPIANGWIYFNTVDDNVSSTVLTTSYQNFLIDETGVNTTHTIYLWVNTAWSVGDASISSTEATPSYTFTLDIQILIS